MKSQCGYKKVSHFFEDDDQIEIPEINYRETKNFNDFINLYKTIEFWATIFII